jgi:hypothetical protein
MMPRTPARMMAETMEEEQTSPLGKILRQIKETKVDEEGGMGPMRRGVKAMTGMAAPGIEAIERMTRRPRRSPDEMSELTREIGRGMGMKKGGKVSSASARADGIAQRGKTRGRMI